MTKRVAVTGSSGLIGGALRRALAERGDDVVRLVRHAPSAPDEVEWDPSRGRLEEGRSTGSTRSSTSPVSASATAGGTPSTSVRSSGRAPTRPVRSRRPSSPTATAPARPSVSSTRRPSATTATGVRSTSPRRARRVRTSSPASSSAGRPRPGPPSRRACPSRWPAPGSSWPTRAAPSSRSCCSAVSASAARWPRGASGGRGSPSSTRCARSCTSSTTRRLTGPFNLVAPGSARQREIASAIGSALSRPAFVPAPHFALRAVIGEFADYVVASQRVEPEALLASGFSFEHPDLESAVRWLVKR